MTIISFAASSASPMLPIKSWMMTMMIMMIRMRVVMMTIIVASSASPLEPNTTLEMYTRIRDHADDSGIDDDDNDYEEDDDKCHHSIPCSQKWIMVTMMLMVSVIFAPRASPRVTMISIIVAPSACPTLPNVTLEMCTEKEEDASDRHDDDCDDGTPVFPTVGHDHYDADDKYHRSIPCVSNDDDDEYHRSIPCVSNCA